MRESIVKSVADVVDAAKCLQTEEAITFIEKVASIMVSTYCQGGKVLIAGNGGSLCDAMHFAEELTGRFRKDRPALGAIALADPGHLSCVANDFGFDEVFARGVEALGKKEDLLVVLSTSGDSRNLIKAVERAESMGMNTVAFLGKGGGLLKGRCTLEWVPKTAPYSDRVQEVHMKAIHIVIEMVENALFAKSGIEVTS